MEKTIGKKRARVILAALVAVALAACAVPAIAALAANDSLPPSTGNLVIHKYQADDMSKIGKANDGTEVTVDPSFAPLSGVTFNIYKVSTDANGDYPSKAPYRLSGTTLTDGDGATFTVAAASPSSVTTADDGKATASNLAQGVYLVVEQENEQVAEPADNFVVAVPMTNADGNGWLSDVHVYPKNQVMYVNKFLTVGKDDAAAKTQNGTAVNVGDTVHYSIVPTVPSGVVAYSTNVDGTPVTPVTTTNVLTEDAKIKYAVTDALDTALTFDAASVKVYGLKASDDVTSGGTLITASGNYSVTTETGNTAKIDFTQAGRIALYNAGYSKLRVELDAVVNDGILSKEKTKVGNTGYVNFTNKFGQEKTKDSTTGFNPDDPKGPDPDPDNPDNPQPTIHTAHISITKKDASNTTTTLAGAKFKIADTEANAKAGNYLRKTADGAVVDPSDSRWATATDWEATSGSDGTFSFDGVEDYTSVVEKKADGTYAETKTYCSYYLVETQAPEGYNLPDAPFKVDFSEATSKESVNWTVSKDVTNTNEFTLPLTGGMGTMLLTLAGILLVGGAGCAFFAAGRKKKKAQAK